MSGRPHGSDGAVMTETDVRRAAMDLLARREHSRVELARKLEQRFAKQRARLARRATKRLLEPWDEVPDSAGGGLDPEPEAQLSAVENAATAMDGPDDPGMAEVRAPAFLIAAALEQLENEGLLSDRRFAEVFVRSRVARGQGPVRIRHDMGTKGLDAGLIHQALDAAEVDWDECAREVLERRFGSDEPADARDRARRMRFLKQRGFSFDACHKLLN